MTDTVETEETEIELDFGAGNVAPLPSRCLRVAKEPTECDICSQVCPTAAITLKELAAAEDESLPLAERPKLSAKEILAKKLGVEVDDDCIHCGMCVTACPVEALTTTKHNPKTSEKQLKDKAAQAEGLALSCARALFGVVPRLAQKAISLPCLAALSPEEWFLASALARDAVYDNQGEDDQAEIVGNLKVYLPSLICEDCPVNTCKDAEATYLGAIAQAEAWGADNIELVSEAEELRSTPTGTLMSALNDVSADGKRELVEQLAQGFKRSWQSAEKDLSRDKNKAAQLAKQRKKINKTSPLNLNAPRPFGKKSQRRRLLRVGLEQDETLAEGVELISSKTEAVLCEGCGNCVDACPLNARRLISSSSVLYFGKLPEEERPQGTQAAVTDELCCLGCSACVQVCPTGACSLNWLSGDDFLKLRQS